MVQKTDLSHDDFRDETLEFRASVDKNFEAYTAYLLKNFYQVAAKIPELQ